MTKVVMVPMMDAAMADIINDDTEEDMAKMIQTGEIPEDLMNDILKEAGVFMNLYNVNPSRFLKGWVVGRIDSLQLTEMQNILGKKQWFLPRGESLVKWKRR